MWLLPEVSIFVTIWLARLDVTLERYLLNEKE